MYTLSIHTNCIIGNWFLVFKPSYKGASNILGFRTFWGKTVYYFPFTEIVCKLVFNTLH